MDEKTNGHLPQGTLDLADEEFATRFDLDAETKFMLFDRDFRGILLDGPRNLPRTNPETIRYLGIRVEGESEHARIDLRSKAVLVSVVQETGQAAVGWGFEEDHVPRPVDHSAEAPEREDLAAFSFRVDLTRQLPGFPLRPGVVESRLILWDRSSNPVRTEIPGPEVTDPEVAAYLADSRPTVYAAPVRPEPGRNSVSYGRDAFSPPPPDGPGIRLHGGRVTPGSDDVEVLVRGCFRLPVREEDRTAPRDPEATTDEPHPVVILPVSLLVTGDEYASPRLVDLRVPCYDDLAEGELATGYFRIDLRDAARLDRYQTYAVWAVSRAVFSDPVLMAWVDPALIGS